MTLNLAPMVDVMMCLIIFFLLATKLVSSQNRPVQLPYAESATEIERAELGQRIVINVRPSPENPRVAEYVVQSFDGRTIREKVLLPDQVAGFLKQRAFEVGGPEKLRCVIRADRSIAYGDVELVIRGCGQEKIARITFGATSDANAETSG